MSDAQPTVAIVIPTYSRSEILPRSLEAVRAVTYPALTDVVLVDDGSPEPHATENRRIAEAAGVNYLRQENSGPAAARNLGIAQTDSELVAFLDDDCAPAPDWLTKLVAPFSDGAARLGGVGGRVVSEPPHNWVSRFCSAAEYATGIQPFFTNAATANACFPRRILEEVDGFDEGFRHPGGDDPDLSRRIREAGYELRFAAESVVYHWEIDRLLDFLGHLYRRGLGEARSKRKEGQSSRVLFRAALFPAFMGRRAFQTWRVTRGKAGLLDRMSYAGVEAVGALCFVFGSVRGLTSRD